MIQTKRIYKDPAPSDGYRVLVDRLWPRGVSKERADLNEWLKDIAPSTELRKWYDHDPAKFAEFTEKYKTELDANTEIVQGLLATAKEQASKGENLTLLYAAKTPDNEAAVLKTYLEKKLDDA
ncbi:DUF488 domain-containing protein [Haematomicrobium sanguinis]|uniref:DUF488 domain-containing protein n=1 Tax=Haematomicrobium sanguinis TaxID=479106 RepID=UPI00047AD6C6|nr:DUF488 family protein [Haematomicrobium sanguinis]